ncbi:hypothetical protein COTS27_00052 [Spirochaetota bacterium]|nr:hypothetical protein COTS27_00052 [Spirochaetota bacterium]
MKRIYIMLEKLVSRMMLFLGESLVKIEHHTKRSIQFYMVIGGLIIVMAWVLAYYVSPWKPLRIDLGAEEEGRAAPVQTPAVPLPQRYLYFNDYYFFEENLDLKVSPELILNPSQPTHLNKDEFKSQFLDSEWFSNDKNIIDKELSRLVR